VVKVPKERNNFRSTKRDHDAHLNAWQTYVGADYQQHSPLRIEGNELFLRWFVRAAAVAIRRPREVRESAVTLPQLYQQQRHVLRVVVVVVVVAAAVECRFLATNEYRPKRCCAVLLLCTMVPSAAGVQLFDTEFEVTAATQTLHHLAALPLTAPPPPFRLHRYPIARPRSLVVTTQLGPNSTPLKLVMCPSPQCARWLLLVPLCAYSTHSTASRLLHGPAANARSDLDC